MTRCRTAFAAALVSAWTCWAIRAKTLRMRHVDLCETALNGLNKLLNQ